MLTSRLIATTLVTALFVMGCDKAKEERQEEVPATEAEPAVDLAAEEQAIRNRSAEWMNYANSKDVASIVNGVFSPDAYAVFDKKVHRGSAAIQAAMDKQVKDMPNAVVSWNTTSVKVAASGDMAVEKGDYVVDPDGEGKKSAISGTYVTVWEKVDGNWRVTADVGADNPPAA